MGKTSRKTGQGAKLPDGAAPSGSSSRHQRQSGPVPRDIQVSKKLSWLLRHGAEKEGLKLGPGGYVNVAEVLSNRLLKSHHVRFEEIKRVVKNNEKKRFGLVHLAQEGGKDAQNEALTYESSDATTEQGLDQVEVDEPLESSDVTATQSESRQANVSEQQSSSTEDAVEHADEDPSHYLIRANQGHSIKLAETSDLLTPITLEAGNLPATVVHGTQRQVWPAILETGGLRPMNRNHVHFATGVPEKLRQTGGTTSSSNDVATLPAKQLNTPDVVSGMRVTSTILVFLDLRKALEQGLKFWMSENGVVLTAGGEDGVVPVELFQKVEEVGGHVLVEEGQVVDEMKNMHVSDGGKGKKKNTKPKLNTKDTRSRDDDGLGED